MGDADMSLNRGGMTENSRNLGAQNFCVSSETTGVHGWVHGPFVLLGQPGPPVPAAMAQSKQLGTAMRAASAMPLV